MDYTNECMICKGDGRVVHDEAMTLIECTGCGLKISADTREVAVAVWNGDVYHPVECQDCDDKKAKISELKSDILGMLKENDKLSKELASR